VAAAPDIGGCATFFPWANTPVRSPRLRAPCAGPKRHGGAAAESSGPVDQPERDRASLTRTQGSAWPPTPFTRNLTVSTCGSHRWLRDRRDALERLRPVNIS